MEYPAKQLTDVRLYSHTRLARTHVHVRSIDDREGIDLYYGFEERGVGVKKQIHPIE